MNKLYGNMKTKLIIKSIGWRFTDFAGGSPGGTFQISPENKLDKSDIFKKPFKNFGRLDDMSKAVCTAVAFALKGVNLYPQAEKQPISIYFNSKEGSLKSDTSYFKDFVDFGETAGRANLFLYTLPTSPLGEASVHFGLTGDVAYLSCFAVPSLRSGSADSDNSLKAMLEAAEDSCEFRKSEKSPDKQFLIGLGNFEKENAEAVFLLVSNAGSTIPQTEEILTSLPDFDNMKKIIYGNCKQ